MNQVGEENYAEFKKWNIGDIIGIEGEVFRTRHGQISVSPTIWCCSPSPCCRCGEMARIKGPELRYRQRYVDLIVNPR